MATQQRNLIDRIQERCVESGRSQQDGCPDLGARSTRISPQPSINVLHKRQAIDAGGLQGMRQADPRARMPVLRWPQKALRESVFGVEIPKQRCALRRRIRLGQYRIDQAVKHQVVEWAACGVAACMA